MDGDGHEDHEEEQQVELSEAEYLWLQEQMKQLQAMGVADDDDWEDPTGGPLRELLDATENDDAEKIKEVLKNSCFPEHINGAGPDGDTALHLSCLYGHKGCFDALLEGGADVNCVNKQDGSTALHDAAAGGYLDIVQVLLSKAKEALLEKFDEDGDTALHNAARGNHLEVVQFLLDRGANPNVQNGSGNKPLDEAEEEPVIALLKPLTKA
ncbi:hypothetical protein HYH03_009372 [Edaphochlamys debaryana]|uniref:Uncharacterized protein n=1 Tax=Edaphochlamys debaryana TaxID=47281 RepID=A0A836BYN3_9CHLO|nr:hypothetical protein HYH03_009372 [Edaphochlamys debaryana]|eukprot:KAG2492429.1 hypothetical protein HYH03_009372 [Edaphochlamys debaryana]